MKHVLVPAAIWHRVFKCPDEREAEAPMKSIRSLLIGTVLLAGAAISSPACAHVSWGVSIGIGLPGVVFAPPVYYARPPFGVVVYGHRGHHWGHRGHWRH